MDLAEDTEGSPMGARLLGKEPGAVLTPTNPSKGMAHYIVNKNFKEGVGSANHKTTKDIEARVARKGK